MLGYDTRTSIRVAFFNFCSCLTQPTNFQINSTQINPTKISFPLLIPFQQFFSSHNYFIYKKITKSYDKYLSLSEEAKSIVD